MQRWKVFRFALAASMLAAGAHAQDVDDKTTCAAVRAVLDAPEPDKMQIRAIGKYVDQALSVIDQSYAENGDPAIIARMSDEGRNGTIAMVTAWCGNHPEEPLSRAVADVSDAVVIGTALVQALETRSRDNVAFAAGDFIATIRAALDTNRA